MAPGDRGGRRPPRRGLRPEPRRARRPPRALRRPGRAATSTALLADPAVEAVYVATPNHLHRAGVEAAARGRQGGALREADGRDASPTPRPWRPRCRRAGILYGTAFDQRHHPAHRPCARPSATGCVGTVTAVRIVYACWLDRGWTPAPARTTGASTAAKAGGGALIDLAPHGLDLVDFLLDEPIEDGRGADAGAACRTTPSTTARCSSAAPARGVLASLHVAYNCPEALPRRRLEIVGLDGAAPRHRHHGPDGGRHASTLIDGASGAASPLRLRRRTSPFLRQVRAFGDALRSGDHAAFSRRAGTSTPCASSRRPTAAGPPSRASRRPPDRPMTIAIRAPEATRRPAFPPTCPTRRGATSTPFRRAAIVGFPLAPLDRTGVPVWYVSLFLRRRALPGLHAERHRLRGDGRRGDRRRRGRDRREPLSHARPDRPPAASRAPTTTSRASAAATASPTRSPSACRPAAPSAATRRSNGRRRSAPAPARRSWCRSTSRPCDVFELPPGYEPFTTLITNGLGAGPDVPFALGHGLLELLQRDGNGLVFRALDQGVVLDLAGRRGRGRRARMLDRLADARHRGAAQIRHRRVRPRQPLRRRLRPRRASRRRPPIALSACGEACDPDRDRALRKALLEFQAARVRKSFSHGPLEDAARVTPPGYVEDFLDRAMPSLDQEEGRALRAMMDWAGAEPGGAERLARGDGVLGERRRSPSPSCRRAPRRTRCARGRIAPRAARRGRLRRPLRRLLAARPRSSASSRRSCRGSRSRP